MRGKTCRDVLVRDFQRGEIRLRAGAEVHDELVAIAELDQPRTIGLRATYEGPAGAECNDAHFIGSKRLSVRKIVVAAAVHGRKNKGFQYSRIMLVSDTSILIW